MLDWTVSKGTVRLCKDGFSIGWPTSIYMP